MLCQGRAQLFAVDIFLLSKRMYLAVKLNEKVIELLAFSKNTSVV